MEKRMKIGSLAIAFALVASLTLAVPALASPDDWEWIPGTYKIDSAAGSQIETHLITYVVGVGETDQTYATPNLDDKLHFVVEYGSIDEDGISAITIPKDNFECDPFYIATTKVLFITKYLWGDLILKENGTGKLATQDDVLDNVDVHVEITGHGDGTFTVTTTKENKGLAGSVTVHLELDLKVYHSPDNTGDPAEFENLVTLPLSVNLTTGKVSIHVTDTTGYPSGSTTLNCKSLSATGTLTSPENGAATLVGPAGALDVYALLSTIIGDKDSYTDFISITTLVIPDNSQWEEIP